MPKAILVGSLFVTTCASFLTLLCLLFVVSLSPEPDKHVFDRHRHKVVLCEGMYILHNDDGWQGISGLFDWNIYLDADIEDCMARLAVRNQCIPGYTPEEIVIRVDKVDRVNALLVQQSKDRADIVVKSVVKTILGPVAKQDLTHKKKQESTTGLLTDVELSDLVGNHDWAMDIVSRPGANSFQHHRFHLVGDVPLRDRSDSVATDKSEPPEPVGKFVGTWEKDMATRIRQLAREKGQAPFMVALVAGPGTGKTVSAMLLADHLEKASLPCMIMPHDGYHYPLDYLKTFPNPQDVIYRRGAPDTFDPHALVRDLARIREGDEDVVKVPAFDHARADPEPDAHIFYRHIHKIVICEGLYLLHPSDGWEDVHAMFDLRIYMNANVDTCIERVKIRNQCIPGYTAEEIAERSELVDRVNFITVQNSKIRADVCVESMC
jgi:pantothenate kinase